MRIVNPPPRPEADPVEHKVTLHEFDGGWHGITHKRTQLSVQPDGLIALDRHVRPEDVEDFVAALRAAVPVAAQVKAKADAQAANLQAMGGDPRRVLSERLTAPALPSHSSRPAFTPERLAAARAKRGGASND